MIGGLCSQSSGMNQASMTSSPGISQATGATFEGGAKRSGRKPQYHLVPLELMQAVAETRAEGDRKYEPGNWMLGSKEFFVDCLGHAIEHLMMCWYDEEESIWTHLGHAACNIGFILWALKRGKVTKRDFQRAAVISHTDAGSSGSQERRNGTLSTKSSSNPLRTMIASFFGFLGLRTGRG